jgi:uncharacterized protein
MTQTPTPPHPLPPLNCHACGGHCCRYFALQVDTPRSAEDFDHLRWYLAHERVAIFLEKNDWYLQVDNPCRFLASDYSCAMYPDRPKICRDYGWDASGQTECHGPDKACDHDEFFTQVSELESYLLRKGKKWSKGPRGQKSQPKTAK